MSNRKYSRSFYFRVSNLLETQKVKNGDQKGIKAEKANGKNFWVGTSLKVYFSEERCFKHEKTDGKDERVWDTRGDWGIEQSIK